MLSSSSLPPPPSSSSSSSLSTVSLSLSDIAKAELLVRKANVFVPACERSQQQQHRGRKQGTFAGYIRYASVSYGCTLLVPKDAQERFATNSSSATSSDAFPSAAIAYWIQDYNSESTISTVAHERQDQEDWLVQKGRFSCQAVRLRHHVRWESCTCIMGCCNPQDFDDDDDDVSDDMDSENQDVAQTRTISGTPRVCCWAEVYRKEDLLSNRMYKEIVLNDVAILHYLAMKGAAERPTKTPQKTDSSRKAPPPCSQGAEEVGREHQQSNQKDDACSVGSTLYNYSEHDNGDEVSETNGTSQAAVPTVGMQPQVPRADERMPNPYQDDCSIAMDPVDVYQDNNTSCREISNEIGVSVVEAGRVKPPHNQPPICARLVRVYVTHNALIVVKEKDNSQHDTKTINNITLSSIGISMVPQGYQTLWNKLQQQGGSLAEPLARHYFQQIVDGLVYLHRMGIYHGDLSLQSIWVNEQDQLLFSHFRCSGFSATISSNPSTRWEYSMWPHGGCEDADLRQVTEQTTTQGTMHHASYQDQYNNQSTSQEDPNCPDVCGPFSPVAATVIAAAGTAPTSESNSADTSHTPPQRPLSAVDIFSRLLREQGGVGFNGDRNFTVEEVEAAVSKQKPATFHQRKIGNLLGTILSSFKEIDSELKELLKNQARTDLERYRTEMERWRQTGRHAMPRRPLSAFAIYCGMERVRISAGFARRQYTETDIQLFLGALGDRDKEGDEKNSTGTTMVNDKTETPPDPEGSKVEWARHVRMQWDKLPQHLRNMLEDRARVERQRFLSELQACREHNIANATIAPPPLGSAQPRRRDCPTAAASRIDGNVVGPLVDAFKVDVWSATALLHVMLVGQVPSRLDQPSSYLSEKVFNPVVLNLLEGGLSSSPIERFSVEQLQQHPWLCNSSSSMFSTQTPGEKAWVSQPRTLYMIDEADEQLSYRFKKPKTFEKPLQDMYLFSPPAALVDKGTSIQEVLGVASVMNKLVLVNIQNVAMFGCHAINRDLWNDDTIQNLISAYFVFWQKEHTDLEGGRVFCNMYGVQTFPHVSILHPQTGQVLWCCEDYWNSIDLSVWKPFAFRQTMEDILSRFMSSNDSHEDVASVSLSSSSGLRHRLRNLNFTSGQETANTGRTHNKAISEQQDLTSYEQDAKQFSDSSCIDDCLHLSLLKHALNCRNEKCLAGVPRCQEMKNLCSHMKTCPLRPTDSSFSQVDSCAYPMCTRTSRLLQHFRSCRSRHVPGPKCAVCSSLRETMHVDVFGELYDVTQDTGMDFRSSLASKASSSHGLNPGSTVGIPQGTGWEHDFSRCTNQGEAVVNQSTFDSQSSSSSFLPSTSHGSVAPSHWSFVMVAPELRKGGSCQAQEPKESVASRMQQAQHVGTKSKARYHKDEKDDVSSLSSYSCLDDDMSSFIHVPFPSQKEEAIKGSNVTSATSEGIEMDFGYEPEVVAHETMQGHAHLSPFDNSANETAASPRSSSRKRSIDEESCKSKESSLAGLRGAIDYLNVKDDGTAKKPQPAMALADTTTGLASTTASTGESDSEEQSSSFLVFPLLLIDHIREKDPELQAKVKSVLSKSLQDTRLLAGGYQSVASSICSQLQEIVDADCWIEVTQKVARHQLQQGLEEGGAQNLSMLTERFDKPSLTETEMRLQKDAICARKATRYNSSAKVRPDARTEAPSVVKSRLDKASSLARAQSQFSVEQDQEKEGLPQLQNPRKNVTTFKHNRQLSQRNASDRKPVTTIAQIEGAQLYLCRVKRELKGDSEKYYEFLNIMQRWKTNDLDEAGAVALVKKLMQGHRELMLGFSIFLSDELQVALRQDVDISTEKQTTVNKTTKESAGAREMGEKEGVGIETVEAGVHSSDILVGKGTDSCADHKPKDDEATRVVLLDETESKRGLLLYSSMVQEDHREGDRKKFGGVDECIKIDDSNGLSVADGELNPDRCDALVDKDEGDDSDDSFSLV